MSIGSTIIETRDLVREFKKTRAVDRMTFSVAPGEAVGYIGANGAGKSTTIKMLTGHPQADSGARAHVRAGPHAPAGRGRPPRRRRLRPALAAVVGPAAARLVRDPRRRSTASTSRRPAPAPTCSSSSSRWARSSARRCARCRSASGCGPRSRPRCCTRPELLILDEPTIGLDVLSKQRLREFLVAERRERGTTLLLTTHDMGDIERLCDRVLVVDHGRLAFDGTLTGLAGTVGAQRVLVIDLAAPTPDLRDVPGATLVESESDGLRQRLAFDAEATTVAAVLAPRLVAARGARPDDRGARHRGRRPPHLRRLRPRLTPRSDPTPFHRREATCRRLRPVERARGVAASRWLRGCGASGCCPTCWA